MSAGSRFCPPVNLHSCRYLARDTFTIPTRLTLSLTHFSTTSARSAVARPPAKSAPAIRIVPQHHAHPH
jgi:hypothetical protein